MPKEKRERGPAYLGNATTAELQAELAARERMGHLHPDYYTTMSSEEYAALGLNAPSAAEITAKGD